MTWGFASIMVPQGFFNPHLYIHRNPSSTQYLLVVPHVNRAAILFYRFIEFFFLGPKCTDDLNYKLNFSSPTSSKLLGLFFTYFLNKEFWNTCEAPPIGIQRQRPNHWKHSYAIFMVHTLNFGINYAPIHKYVLAFIDGLKRNNVKW